MRVSLEELLSTEDLRRIMRTWDSFEGSSKGCREESELCENYSKDMNVSDRCMNHFIDMFDRGLIVFEELYEY